MLRKTGFSFFLKMCFVFKLWEGGVCQRVQVPAEASLVRASEPEEQAAVSCSW